MEVCFTQLRGLIVKMRDVSWTKHNTTPLYLCPASFASFARRRSWASAAKKTRSAYLTLVSIEVAYLIDEHLEKSFRLGTVTLVVPSAQRDPLTLAIYEDSSPVSVDPFGPKFPTVDHLRLRKRPRQAVVSRDLYFRYGHHGEEDEGKCPEPKHSDTIEAQAFPVYRSGNQTLRSAQTSTRKTQNS